METNEIEVLDFQLWKGDFREYDFIKLFFKLFFILMIELYILTHTY